MNRLITAEFRKIFTTKLWWALLIPAFVLAFGWAWVISAISTGFADGLSNTDVIREFDVPVDEMSWSAIALARSINLASIFPMAFGALGLASELSRKTITTTFLTAPNRASVLGAKAITYVIWGAIYGLAIGAAVSVGVLVGSGSNYLPDGKAWFLILLAGLIQCILWSLVGLGVGALIGSPVGTLVLLLVYALVVGPLSEIALTSVTEGSYAAGFMPNGSANGLTSSTAGALLFDQIQNLVLNRGGSAISASQREDIEQTIRAIAGAPGSMSLWLSGLVFLVWTAIFFVSGMARNRRRDIT